VSERGRGGGGRRGGARFAPPTPPFPRPACKAARGLGRATVARTPPSGVRSWPPIGGGRGGGGGGGGSGGGGRIEAQRARAEPVQSRQRAPRHAPHAAPHWVGPGSPLCRVRCGGEGGGGRVFLWCGLPKKGEGVKGGGRRGFSHFNPDFQTCPARGPNARPNTHRNAVVPQPRPGAAGRPGRPRLRGHPLPRTGRPGRHRALRRPRRRRGARRPGGRCVRVLGQSVGGGRAARGDGAGRACRRRARAARRGARGAGRGDGDADRGRQRGGHGDRAGGTGGERRGGAGR
jgi:hypothetical protein